MRVVITPRANLGLVDIGDWIARDDPVRAASFIDELIVKALQIGDRPRAYPVLPRYRRQEIRRRVHRTYLILYRIRPDFVEVLQFVHGARDYDSLLDIPPDDD